MKEYGILYAKVCFPKDHRLHWLGHCGIFNILPKDLKDEIIKLSNHINQKWKDIIVVGNFPIMIKVGRTVDHGWEPGMFRV